MLMRHCILFVKYSLLIDALLTFNFILEHKGEHNDFKYVCTILGDVRSCIFYI